MKIKVETALCGVLAGAILEVKTTVLGWRRLHLKTEYFLCTDGGRILFCRSGKRSRIMHLDTTSLKAGTYTIKAHVAQGP